MRRRGAKRRRGGVRGGSSLPAKEGGTDRAGDSGRHPVGSPGIRTHDGVPHLFEDGFPCGALSPQAVARGPRLGGRIRRAALALLVAPGLSFAAPQERAPRRPPEPFRVFVEASDRAGAELTALLEQALPAVRDRVERRRRWFALAESAETADLTLRVVNYRTGHRSDPNWESFYAPILEFHYVDAVAVSDGVRTLLSGLDQRPLGHGASLRNAAGHLAEELERFCREHYAALARKDEGGRERWDGAAPPWIRNAPGPGR